MPFTQKIGPTTTQTQLIVVPDATFFTPGVVTLAQINGGGGSAAATVFLFQPGGPGGKDIFTDWATLMAASDAVSPLPRTIAVDSSFAPCVIPAGTWNMVGVTLSGSSGGLFSAWNKVGFAPAGVMGGTQSSVTIQEGAIFTQLRSIGSLLAISFTGSTPPVSDFSTVTTDVFFMGVLTELECDGSGPFCLVGTGATAVFLLQGAQLLGTSTPIVHGSASSFCELAVFDAASTGANILSGDVGSFMAIVYEGSSGQLDTDQPAVLGTLRIANNTNVIFDPTPTITTGSQSASKNEILRCDTTSGPITLQFPPAAGSPGNVILVKNQSDDAVNAITVTPNGSDTIDGAATATVSGARASNSYMSDGVSDWMQIPESEGITLPLTTDLPFTANDGTRQILVQPAAVGDSGTNLKIIGGDANGGPDGGEVHLQGGAGPTQGFIRLTGAAVVAETQLLEFSTDAVTIEALGSGIPSTSQGPVTIQAADAVGPGDFDGGNVDLKTGSPSGAGLHGIVTADEGAGTFSGGLYASAVGAVLASASTIAPTNTNHHISGTAAIDTITPPFPGFTGTLVFIFDSTASFTTAGNVATALTAAANQRVAATFDGSLWYVEAIDSDLFAVLAGQSGGQTLNGDTLTGGTLTLRPNAIDTLGVQLTSNGLSGVSGVEILPASEGHSIGIANNGAGAGSTFVVQGASGTTDGGDVNILGGNAAAGHGGAITIDTGTATNGVAALEIGNANALNIQFARAAANTTFSGTHDFDATGYTEFDRELYISPTGSLQLDCATTLRTNATIASAAGSTSDLLIDANAAQSLKLGTATTLGAIIGSASNKVGFYGSAGATQPTVTGSKGLNAALGSLITALASLGIIIDSTTP